MPAAHRQKSVSRNPRWHRLLTGIVLIAAGAAIAAGVKVYPAAAALTVFFALWIVLLQVPSAFVDPILLRSPWWVRTFETLALTGAALILAGLASEPVREGWIRTGRIAFGVSLPVFGVLHFIYADNVASLIPSWYLWPLFLAYLTGAGHFAAGVAIATGVLPRLAATLAGFMYGIWALTLHIPSQFEYERPQGEQTSLFVAIAMWGAAWIVAGSLAEPREAQAGQYDSQAKGGTGNVNPGL
jgi:uncharacterized membrane protein YphA (DoxX/SURF4 family)